MIKKNTKKKHSATTSQLASTLVKTQLSSDYPITFVAAAQSSILTICSFLKSSEMPKKEETQPKLEPEKRKGKVALTSSEMV